MEYLEYILGSACGWTIGQLAFMAARRRLLRRSTHSHDLIVAALLHASGNRTREGLRHDCATGTVAEIDASLMRLTARGLVERKFVGNEEVPFFELTPEGATILADDS